MHIGAANTGYGLGVRFLAAARDVSVLHIFQTGSQADPVSYIMGTGVK
jgi:hypothetical protein